MLLFYAVAGAIALATGLAIARPLLLGRAGSETRATQDARLYRDQLEEIDRDLARGTITEGEAIGVRAEVSRRLLAATARAEAGGALAPAPRAPSALLAAVALIGAPALALVIYLANGAPGMPDLPFIGRQAPPHAALPSQPEAAAATVPTPPPATAETEEFARLIAQLEGLVQSRPDDVQGRRLLANGYVRLGRNAEAWRAYAELIRLVGIDREPELLAAQINAMVMAADGYVSPEARAVLADAVARIPGDPMVRYYLGLSLAQSGDIDGAIATWESLKATASPDAPWLAFVESMLAEARALQQPQGAAPAPAAPGPDAETMAAAARMSPEERQAMIETMVGRLETRLTTEGGSVEEWVRLINAYVQLDRPEDARRIYGLGLAALGDSTEAGFLREQALLLGVPIE